MEKCSEKETLKNVEKVLTTAISRKCRYKKILKEIARSRKVDTVGEYA